MLLKLSYFIKERKTKVKTLVKANGAPRPGRLAECLASCARNDTLRVSFLGELYVSRHSALEGGKQMNGGMEGQLKLAKLCFF